MTGFLKKTVRFSKTTKVHSPPTPALSFGSMSPASSGAPLTPPQYTGGLPGPTPYGFSNIPYNVPKPPQHHSRPPRMQLHPYLEYSRHAAVQFDLLNPATAATRHHHPISPQAFAEPATSPPLPSIIIESSSPAFPWQMRIMASNRHYVTVWDVLDQLHRSLRLNVTRREYDSLTGSEQRKANAAYEHRYKRYRSRREYDTEKAGGMKRVDFLMNRSWFMGLSRTAAHDVWILNSG